MKVGEQIKTFSATVLRVDEKRVRKTFTEAVQRYSMQQMFDNEVGALKRVQHLPGFQQLLEYDFPHITTRYCGVELPKSQPDHPADVLQQMEAFVQALDTVEMVHRDVLPRNILYHEGQLTLIDFTWAYYPGCAFNNINDAPRGLGGRWNPKGGFSNAYSIDIIKKEWKQHA